MKKLISTHWITLDGYIAGKSGEMDWIMGDDQLSGYEIGLVSGADTLLLGKTTYRDFSSYWPLVPTNPNAPPWEKTYAEKVNAMRKVVISRQLRDAAWKDSEIIREVTPETIAELKSGAGANIVMYGSATVVQQLTDLGLIDEYHLLYHPVLLGGGRALFDPLEKPVKLKPVRAEQFKSGVSLQIFRPAA